MDTGVGNINFEIELCEKICLHSSLTINKLVIITFTFSMKYEETHIQGVALVFAFCTRFPLEGDSLGNIFGNSLFFILNSARLVPAPLNTIPYPLNYAKRKQRGIFLTVV